MVAYDRIPAGTCSDREKQDGSQLILLVGEQKDDDGLLVEEADNILVLQELDNDDVVHASDEDMDAGALMLPDDMDRHPMRVEVVVDVLGLPLNASFALVAVLPK